MMFKRSIYYLGNKYLRRANVEIPLSPFQIEEIIKCEQDFFYFMRNYVKIVDESGLIPFIPRDYQAKFLETIDANRFVISMQSRQMGKSIAVCSYIAWFAIFHEEKRCAILANKDKMAKALMADVKKMIQNLPIWMQQGLVEWNTKSVEFENGSTIFCETTTENSLRGDTPHFVLLDEFAHIATNVADGFIASVYPSITASQNSKIVIVSTPKGLNHFYKTWNDALNKENSYVPFRVDWWEHPNRDEAWREETVKNIGEQRFAQEFGNDFMGSAGTLISASKLKVMTHQLPIEETPELKIYNRPEEEHEYIICVDVAHGKGLDYTVCSIIDTSSIPYKYVAKYRSNTISPLAVPEMIFNLARTYNNAYVLIEINDLGFAVAESLYNELEYENIFTVKLQGRTGQVLSYNMGRKTTKGVKMTSAVKKIGCANIKSLIENDKLIVEDYDAIKEMTTFTFKQNMRGGTYQADDGEHDDIIMTLVLFGWLVNDKIFSELADVDIRKNILDVDLEQIEETLVPVGYFGTNATFGVHEEVIQAGEDTWYR